MPEVIADPGLPAKVRRVLEEAPPEALVSFNSPPVRARRLRCPGMRRAALAVRMLLVTSIAVYFLAGALHARDPGPVDGALAGIGFFTFILTSVSALALRIPIRKLPPRDAAQAAAGAAVTCHRRYVLPDADLDGECLALWRREIAAARQISESAVVGEGVIDSVEVATVLPHHLWEVAERLAILSGPQRQQREILKDLDLRDPDVRAVLDPQQRAHQIAITDITPRINNLAEFAALTVRADAAVKRKKALQELMSLNPAYEEILARLGGSQNQLSASGHAADELRAVAAEADEAVRRANEAGRSLVIPERLTGPGHALARDPARP